MNAWLIARVILGLLIAPLAPGLLFGSLDALFVPSPFGMQFFIGIASAAGYPPLLLAIIVYALALKRLPRSIWECILVGALLGALAYFLAFLNVSSNGVTYGFSAVASTIGLIPLGMICGAIAGSAFWLFIRRWRTVEVAPVS
jgi:hypothetical protein